MIWIQTHPRRVKEIARNDQAFYERYLALEPTIKLYHDLLYRVALKQIKGRE